MYICIFILSVMLLAALLPINRDIPMPLVTSGVEHGNLRELAMGRMKDLGAQVSLPPHIVHITAILFHFV